MEDPLFASARFQIEKPIVLYGELEYQKLTLIPKNKALKTPSPGEWINDFDEDGWSKAAVVIDYLNMNSAYIPQIKIGTSLSMTNTKKTNGSEVELEDNVIIYECTKPVSTAIKFDCKKSSLLLKSFILQVFQTDLWPCPDGQKISASKLCDTVPDCNIAKNLAENRFLDFLYPVNDSSVSADEDPEMCEGIPIAEFFGTAIFITYMILGIIVYACK